MTTSTQPVTKQSTGAPQLPFGADFETRAVSPDLEMGAYEALWCDPRTTFKTLAQRFHRHPGSIPSYFVSREEAIECADLVKQLFAVASNPRFGVSVHGIGEYPSRLWDAKHPVEVLYYQGRWDLVASR